MTDPVDPDDPWDGEVNDHDIGYLDPAELGMGVASGQTVSISATGFADADTVPAHASGSLTVGALSETPSAFLLMEAEQQSEWESLSETQKWTVLLQHLLGGQEVRVRDETDGAKQLKRCVLALMESAKTALRTGTGASLEQGIPELRPWDWKREENWWTNKMREAHLGVHEDEVLRRLQAAVKGREELILSCTTVDLAPTFNAVLEHWPATRSYAETVDTFLNDQSLWTSDAITADPTLAFCVEWTRAAVATWASFISAMNMRALRYSTRRPTTRAEGWDTAREPLARAEHHVYIIKQADKCFNHRIPVEFTCQNRYVCTIPVSTIRDGRVHRPDAFGGCLSCAERFFEADTCSRYHQPQTGRIVGEWGPSLTHRPSPR